MEAAPEDESRILPSLIEKKDDDACDLLIPSLVSSLKTGPTDSYVTPVWLLSMQSGDANVPWVKGEAFLRR